MGVKYGREYNDIMKDFYRAIRDVEGLFGFFEMNESQWLQLETAEQDECVKTLADDLFYALATDPSIRVGEGRVEYDRSNHIIKVLSGEKLIHIVNLV